MNMQTLCLTAAVITVPVLVGRLTGLGLRRLRRRRFAGPAAAILLFLVPTLALTALSLRFPILGFWDGLVEAMLVGLGIEWSAHRAFTEPTNVALGSSSLLASLILLELGCRMLLPAPPGFPTGSGPHLLLADAMHADAQHHSWGFKSKEIVGSIVYEDQYRVSST
jgi:NhaP-type Na+/H+ or K+/H+ antiporter